VSAQQELARRYRAYLALYPRAYRDAHEDEMLGVLLEGARPGQQFPGLVESADLIWGAIQIRMRLLRSYPSNVGSDALAVFSLVAPLLLLAPVLATMALHLIQAGPPPMPHLRTRMPILFRRYEERVELARALNFAVAGQLAVAAAVVLRLRRLALAAIAVILAWWIFSPQYGIQTDDVLSNLLLTCYLLEAVALLASPGPRRGLQLMTWRSAAFVAAAAAALTVTWTLTLRLDFNSAFTSWQDARANAEAVVVLLILAAAAVLLSQLWRCVVVLFAAVFYPYLLSLARVALIVRWPFQSGEATVVTVMYVPPLLAISAVVALAYRRRDGRAPSSSRSSGTLA
jgi:hypothetical protein